MVLLPRTRSRTLAKMCRFDAGHVVQLHAGNAVALHLQDSPQGNPITGKARTG